ncbi:MAG: hypothetical protein WCL39_15470, partial [Armatimonadota bacterium]
LRLETNTQMPQPNCAPCVVEKAKAQQRITRTNMVNGTLRSFLFEMMPQANPWRFSAWTFRTKQFTAPFGRRVSTA